MNSPEYEGLPDIVLSRPHWRNVLDCWEWPAFSPREIACPATGKIVISSHAMNCLTMLRSSWGRPLHITSAYRSPEHNERVGGVKNSYHTKGQAFDIAMLSPGDAEWFIECAKNAGFTGIGTYPRGRFIHIDTGPERSWGDPFIPLPRKPLRESRTLAAGGVAWISTLSEVLLRSVTDNLKSAVTILPDAFYQIMSGALITVTLCAIVYIVFLRCKKWIES